MDQQEINHKFAKQISKSLDQQMQLIDLLEMLARRVLWLEKEIELLKNRTEQ